MVRASTSATDPHQFDAFIIVHLLNELIFAMLPRSFRLGLVRNGGLDGLGGGISNIDVVLLSTEFAIAHFLLSYLPYFLLRIYFG